MDNQAKFWDTFGSNPFLWPAKPTDTSIDAASKKLQKYSAQCQLDIFMHLCQLDYVGDEKIDPALNTVELCCQINEMR